MNTTQRNMLAISRATNCATDYEEHKSAVMAAVHAHARQAGYVSRAINEAIADGIARADIIDWIIEAGYSESYARSTVSACFVTSGKRVSKTPGRQVDERAKALLADVEHRFGTDGVKLLLAAYRYAKSQKTEPVANAA